MSEANDHDKAPGVFGWREIVTRDKDASVNFYSGLFGWTTQSMDFPGGSYTMFMQGERMVAGIMELPPEAGDAPPMWLSYVNVADLDASVAKAKELGGKICRERMDLPMGSFAIVSDPEGASLAFWEANPDACPDE